MRTSLRMITLVLAVSAAHVHPDQPRAIMPSRVASIEFDDQRQRVVFRVSETVSYIGIVEVVDELGWGGRLEGTFGTFAMFEERGRRHARLHVLDKVYRFQPAGAGYAVTEIDASDPQPCGAMARRPQQQVLSSGAIDYCSTTNARPVDPCWNAEADMAAEAAITATDFCAIQDNPNAEPVNILVSVVYTPAVTAARGFALIREEVRLSIIETNLSFWLSDIPAKIALARRPRVWWLPSFCKIPCLDEIAFNESTSLDTDLAGLFQLENVRRLRARCDADTVLLLIEDQGTQYSGMACVMKQLTHAYGKYALGIAEFESIIEDYNFTHELGHMMGGGHRRDSYDQQHGCQLGMCPDSAGWHFDHDANPATEDRKTIMAYEGPKSLFFSDGGPLRGSTDANNARTLRISAETVSNFQD